MQKNVIWLTNATVTFQRFMESGLFRCLPLNWCIIYFNDIIIFSKTPKEHLQRLRGEFEKLSEAVLKLKFLNCEFFRNSLSELGHVVSKNGIETDKRK